MAAPDAANGCLPARARTQVFPQTGGREHCSCSPMSCIVPRSKRGALPFAVDRDACDIVPGLKCKQFWPEGLSDFDFFILRDICSFPGGVLRCDTPGAGRCIAPRLGLTSKRRAACP